LLRSDTEKPRWSIMARSCCPVGEHNLPWARTEFYRSLHPGWALAVSRS
jgi:hypothetical protein